MKLPSRYTPTGRFFGGGQGVVTVWRDTSLDRDVAVKVLSTQGIGGSLRNEAMLLGKIKSKHVVELLDVGIEQASKKEYMIMEYVTGSDLDTYSPKDVRDLYLTLYQIVAGVADIHTAECIHRDLKPTNIKRDDSGIIKIIDFGIGVDGRQVQTASGRGTPGYRGHEFYKTNIILSASTDIYALAVLAYKFCFGGLDAAFYDVPPTSPPSFASATLGQSKERLAAEISSLLDQCLDSNPAIRPSAIKLKRTLAKHISQGVHVANFVHNGKPYSISRSSPSYGISFANCSFEISYDGIDFVLKKVSGDIFVNGIQVGSAMPLFESCVITMGAGSGIDRVFIPFNVSHPEVVL